MPGTISPYDFEATLLKLFKKHSTSGLHLSETNLPIGYLIFI